LFPLAIFIGGPTASQKSKLAFQIQSKISSFIINADSMQVYDKLNILTNKPKSKLIDKYDCKLFNFLSYPKKCNVGLWRRKSIELLKKTKKTPIFVGGTGLYLDSLINNISNIPPIPEKIKLRVNRILSVKGKSYFYEKLLKIDNSYATKISKNDTQRILRAIEVKVATGKNFSYWHKHKKENIFERVIYVVLNLERDDLYKNINERCKEMLSEGVVDEVKKFLKSKISADHPLHKAIGLEILSNYSKGKIKTEEALSLFSRDTRRYAKRQLTWFKNRAESAKNLGFNDSKNYILNNL